MSIEMLSAVCGEMFNDKRYHHITSQCAVKGPLANLLHVKPDQACARDRAADGRARKFLSQQKLTRTHLGCRPYIKTYDRSYVPCPGRTTLEQHIMDSLTVAIDQTELGNLLEAWEIGAELKLLL